MATFSLEIDFVAVGEGERSGDAIAFRYGSPSDGYTVVVIDGGTKESGARLVELIRRYYQTDTVNHVINGHPDADHSSGLTVVLENLCVENLWMHRPWMYAADVLALCQSGRVTSTSFKERTKEALSAAWQLEQTAKRRKIPISQPFQGTVIGGFHVLSPSEDWYKLLVANFRGTPEAKPAAAAGFFGGGLRTLRQAAQTAVEWVGEAMNVETLREGGETSAENESSVVLYGNVEGHTILLTGDAGIQALTRSVLYARNRGVLLNQLDFVQVPHHGSRNNVSPTILNHVMGKVAFVSAAKMSTTHPRRAVTNAFIRRGATIYATKGNPLHMPYGAIQRAEYSYGIPSIPFYDKVEAYS